MALNKTIPIKSMEFQRSLHITLILFADGTFDLKKHLFGYNIILGTRVLYITFF